MPKKARTLSALEVKRLTTPGFHAVGDVAGLLLRVDKSGARSWILRYTTGETRLAKSGKPYKVRRDHGLARMLHRVSQKSPDARLGGDKRDLGWSLAAF